MGSPKYAHLHPFQRPHQRKLARRVNNRLVYNCIRRAIRECKAKEPILLAPCGYGWFFDKFRADGIEVVGLELVPKDVEWARKAVVPPFVVHEGNALKMPFKDGEFDFVVVNRFIPHFPDEFCADAMKEFARVAGRYVLVHYDYPVSLRQLGRKLRGAKEPARNIDKFDADNWRRTQIKERKKYHDLARMEAEGAPAGLKVKKLYFVLKLFSDRVYCLYEKK